MIRFVAAALFWLASISATLAAQANLFSPTTGTVSGLQLTLNYNNAFTALATCNSGTVAPANDQSGVAVEGQCWLDTSSTPHKVKIFDSAGGQWLIIGYLDSTNHIWTPVVAGGAVNTVASAATTDLCSTQPAYLQISGTTTITSFGSSCITGQTKWATFTGALTLTNNAASLILPNGGSNIQTSAGDVIQAVYLGGGNWRVVDYVPVGGLAPPPTMTLVGDANYTVLVTDNNVVTNAALSAARTWTLFAANAAPAGKRLQFCDRVNGVTSTNTLSINRAGSDTIVAQGTTVTGIVIQNAGDCLSLVTDGVNKWIVPDTELAPQASTFLSGSSLTYTTPVGAKYIRVRMTGGGGGGGAGTTNNGSNGGDTSFGGWTALHGIGGLINGGAGGGGGGGVNGTGVLITRVNGGAGGGQFGSGAPGGQGPFGGGGSSQISGGTAQNATPNTGGGGGGGSNGTTNVGGGGGGAGEFVEFIVTSPAVTFTYTVGSGGSGGAAGTNAGGNGAAGRIEVVAYYQ